MNINTSQQVANRVSMVSVLANSLLSIVKLTAGIIGNSTAMVSDAVHSISDIFSTIIVMIGFKVSTKEADKNHPFGHERFESVTAIILAFILTVVGAGIGYSGIQKVFFTGTAELIVPGGLALGAAVISIIIKEAMYWYTKISARKINSGALMADAWHHRSDAMSSVGSFIGIAGARLGFPMMDPLASIVICLLILKVALSIFTDSINKMTDTSCDESMIEEIKDIILDQPGVLGIDKVKTRMFGNRSYVEVENRANGEEPLNVTHEIAHQVHDAVEKNFQSVKHCTVHVNPVHPNNSGNTSF